MRKILILILFIISLCSSSFGQASGLSGKRFGIYFLPQTAITNGDKLIYTNLLSFQVDYVVAHNKSIGFSCNFSKSEKNVNFKDNTVLTKNYNGDIISEQNSNMSFNDNIFALDYKVFGKLAPLKSYYHLGLIYGISKGKVIETSDYNETNYYFPSKNIPTTFYGIRNGFGTNYGVFKRGILGYELFLDLMYGSHPAFNRFMVRFGMEFRLGAIAF